MIRHLPVLIILCPLVTAQLCILLSLLHVKVGRVVSALACASSLVMSVMLLQQVLYKGPIHYCFGAYKMPIGIEFYIDTVSALILILISLIGFLTFLNTRYFTTTDDKLLIGGSNTMILLLMTGMLGMTATGDVFNLYVFLEITSLSAYCLIALGGSRGVVSAFRYMLVGTIAATFYLLGVGILYANTGTLNMADMAKILDKGGYDNAMLLAMVFLIAAFGIKMALFPFHGWQPSAYTHAEAGARPLISGVMGKIPAIAMFRYLYCIFGTDFIYFRYFLYVIGVFSVCGMIYGSVRAMAQTDARKVFAYSSVAQIGYISLGFAIGTPIALAGAFMHMIGHAFMKSGLFFATGAVRWKYGTTQLDNFGRIYKKMPLTCGLFTVAALSMIGIPPTVGFFSKWYLAVGAASTQHYVYLGVLVLSSLLNAVYFFKLIEKIFINPSKDLPEVHEVNKGELPIGMIIPVVVCFLAIILLGVFNVKIVDILLVSLKGVAL